ncbi:aspartate-semialdehyde dehydrogenase [Caldiplasma sukawensis]
MDRLNAAILGATGIIGQEFLRLNRDEKLFHISSLYGSEKSQSKSYIDAVNWIFEDDCPERFKNMKVENVNSILQHVKDYDIVFSFLPTQAANIEKEIAEYLPVITKSSLHRMDQLVPLVIPEINTKHLDLIPHQKKKNGWRGYITADPNCSTNQLVISIHPFLKYNIKRVYLTSFQSSSGAGFPGPSFLNLNGNIIPYIEGEEDKIYLETKKILGELKNETISYNNIEIVARCLRSPVRVGHLQTVFIEFENEIDENELVYSLKNSKLLENNYSRTIGTYATLKVVEKEDRPQPLLDSETGSGMTVTIGGIQFHNNAISFNVLGNNLSRGGSGNSILQGEMLLEKGYI